MFLFDITINFDKACESLIKDDPEFLKYVKTHERKNLVLNNLCKQVFQAENKLGSRMNVGVRNKLILEVAKMFVDAAKIAHEQKTWSQAERNRQIAKANPFSEMTDVIKDQGGRVYSNGVLTEVEKA